MKRKKVYIIGAGIAGLTVGSYLQMNHYDTEIFEAHKAIGGLCTSWKRGGYTFDGCIHSTVSPHGNFRLNQWFSELIDFNKLEYHFHDELVRVVFHNGGVFPLYTDPDKLEPELLNIAPADRAFIQAFIKGIRVFSKHDMLIAKPLELWNPLDYYVRQFSVLPYIWSLSTWSASLETTLQRCTTPKLKRILTQEFFTRYPAYFFLISFAQMHAKQVGYPIGGSAKFVGLLGKKYRELGGKIHVNTPVVKIVERHHTARGVSLNDRTTRDDADLVISAGDGYATIFTLLNGQYTNRKIRERYNSHPKWPSLVLVSLGIAREFPDEPSAIDLSLNHDLMIDATTQTSAIPITIYNFDPTLAPPGKTVIRVILHTQNFHYWNELRTHDIDQYTHEKDRIGHAIVDILEEYLGNIKQYVEVVDVATPATFHRYTGNWQGIIHGWKWLPGLIPEHIKPTLPRLKNFYMAGQWVLPGGGISGAFITARHLSQIICAKDKKPFRSRL